MSNRLQITEIHLDAGKFANRIDPFNGQSFEDFTVVYGANETGKSTISDLMVWLLTAKGFEKKFSVGTTPKEETLFRFGGHNDKVSGELEGFLRGKKFALKAGCTIGKSGSATKFEFSGSLDGDEITTSEKWQEKLLGLSEELFGRIYFLQGLNLHSNREAVAELQSLASGTDGFEINKTMNDLEARASQQLTKKGNSTPSTVRHRKFVKDERRDREEDLDDIKSEATQLTESEAARKILIKDRDEKIDEKKEIEKKIKEMEKREALFKKVCEEWGGLEAEVARTKTEKEIAEEEYAEVASLLEAENVDLSDDDVHLDEEASTDLLTRIDSWRTSQDKLSAAENDKDVLQNDEKTYDEQRDRALEAFSSVVPDLSPEEYSKRISRGQVDESSELREEAHDTDKRKNLAVNLTVFVFATLAYFLLPSPWSYFSILGLGGFMLVPFFNRFRTTGREANNVPTGLTESNATYFSDKKFEMWKAYDDCKEVLEKRKKELESLESEVRRLKKDVDENKRYAISFAQTYGFEIGEEVNRAEKIRKYVRRGVINKADLKKKETDYDTAFENLSNLKESFIAETKGADYFSEETGDPSLEGVEEALKNVETEKETAEREVSELDDALGGLNIDLGGINSTIERLQGETEYSETLDEIASLNEEIAELEIEAASLGIAKYLLEKAAEKYADEARPGFLQEVSKYYTDITGEEREVRPSVGADTSVFVKVKGSKLELENLSTASRAQLYLSFRLAMADQDAENKRGGLKIPLICDDSLVHFDDERAEATLPILKEIADKERQVILFTCHERTRKSAKAIGVKVIEL